MSTKPGATTRPLASIVRRAGSETEPIATILPSRRPRLPRFPGAPVPSTRVPPSIRTSNIALPPWMGPGYHAPGVPDPGSEPRHLCTQAQHHLGAVDRDPLVDEGVERPGVDVEEGAVQRASVADRGGAGGVVGEVHDLARDVRRVAGGEAHRGA